MSLSDPYATAEEYRAVIKPDALAIGDDLITSDLIAISRYLDLKLGQFFGQEDEESEHVFEYDPTCHSSRYKYPTLNRSNTDPVLPPFVSVSSVRWESIPEILAADLDLYPFDAPQRPEPEPYRAIGRSNLLPWPSYQGVSRRNRVTVVMKAGWPAIPPAIKATTIQICAMLRLETPRATRRIPEMGEAIETSPSAQALIYLLFGQYKLDWLY